MTSWRIRSMPLPNLIFAADPGCGITMHIKLLAELLKELQLLHFVGEEMCFEWELSDEEQSMERLFLRIQRAAGFYAQFQGIVGLDVSKLLTGRKKEDALKRLMEFVDSKEGKTLFVFIIPFHDSETTQKQLIGCFASHTPVELIHMQFPRKEAQYYIVDQLFGQGFEVTREAQEILKKAVLTVSRADDFEGYQTLQNLTDEIVWHKLSQLPPVDEIITASDVRFILEDGGCVTALQAHGIHRTHRRVGFGEEGKQ